MAIFEEVGVRAVLDGVAAYERDASRVNNATQRIVTQAAQAARDAQAQGQALFQIGSRIRTISQEGVLVGAALSAPGLAVAHFAVQFESAFAGVRKTVEGTEAELAGLRQGLLDLTRTIPTSAGGLAGIAEAAGQLGIAKSNIIDFTRVTAELAATTNLTADVAATSLARFANILQLPQDQIERVGSALVDLGNKGASTESEILDFALRLAGAGKVIGLSADQVLGFGNALASLGINAEAGGTAFSRVFVEIAKAVSLGGADLDRFAQVAGTSGAQFAASFRTNASAAVIQFVEGLGKIEAAGGPVFQTLESLSLGDNRLRDALLRASGAGDLLRESLSNGATAFRENTALTTEFGKRVETTGAQFQLLLNSLQRLAIDAGTALLPALQVIVKALQGVVDVINSLPTAITGGIAGFSLLVGGVTIATSAIGYLGGSLVAIIGALKGFAGIGAAGEIAAVDAALVSTASAAAVAVPGMEAATAAAFQMSIGFSGAAASVEALQLPLLLAAGGEAVAGLGATGAAVGGVELAAGAAFPPLLLVAAAIAAVAVAATAGIVIYKKLTAESEDLAKAHEHGKAAAEGLAKALRDLAEQDAARRKAAADTAGGKETDPQIIAAIEREAAASKNLTKQLEGLAKARVDLAAAEATRPTVANRQGLPLATDIHPTEEGQRLLDRIRNFQLKNVQPPSITTLPQSTVVLPAPIVQVTPPITPEVTIPAEHVTTPPVPTVDLLPPVVSVDQPAAPKVVIPPVAITEPVVPGIDLAAPEVTAQQPEAPEVTVPPERVISPAVPEITLPPPVVHATPPRAPVVTIPPEIVKPPTGPELLARIRTAQPPPGRGVTREDLGITVVGEQLGSKANFDFAAKILGLDPAIARIDKDVLRFTNDLNLNSRALIENSLAADVAREAEIVAMRAFFENPAQRQNTRVGAEEDSGRGAAVIASNIRRIAAEHELFDAQRDLIVLETARIPNLDALAAATARVATAQAKLADVPPPQALPEDLANAALRQARAQEELNRLRASGTATNAQLDAAEGRLKDAISDVATESGIARDALYALAGASSADERAAYGAAAANRDLAKAIGAAEDAQRSRLDKFRDTSGTLEGAGRGPGGAAERGTVTRQRTGAEVTERAAAAQRELAGLIARGAEASAIADARKAVQSAAVDLELLAAAKKRADDAAAANAPGAQPFSPSDLVRGTSTAVGPAGNPEADVLAQATDAARHNDDLLAAQREATSQATQAATKAEQDYRLSIQGRTEEILAQTKQSRVRALGEAVGREAFGIQGPNLSEVQAQQARSDAIFQRVRDRLVELGVEIPEGLIEVFDRMAEVAESETKKKGEVIGGLLGFLISRRLGQMQDLAATGQTPANAHAFPNPGVDLVPKVVPGGVNYQLASQSTGPPQVNIDTVNIGSGTTTGDIAQGFGVGLSVAYRGQQP